MFDVEVGMSMQFLFLFRVIVVLDRKWLVGESCDTEEIRRRIL